MKTYSIEIEGNTYIIFSNNDKDFQTILKVAIIIDKLNPSAKHQEENLFTNEQ